MTNQPTGEWMAVLDRIEDAVKQLLERAADPPALSSLEGPTPIDRLGERAAAWESSLAHIEDEAKAASRDFNAEEETITEWKSSLAQLRQEVIAWQSRAS